MLLKNTHTVNRSLVVLPERLDSFLIFDCQVVVLVQMHESHRLQKFRVSLGIKVFSRKGWRAFKNQKMGDDVGQLLDFASRSRVA